jgi:hypothetical protein
VRTEGRGGTYEDGEKGGMCTHKQCVTGNGEMLVLWRVRIKCESVCGVLCVHPLNTQAHRLTSSQAHKHTSTQAQVEMCTQATTKKKHIL